MPVRLRHLRVALIAASGCLLGTAAVPELAIAAGHARRGRDVLVVASSYSGTVDLIDARSFRRLGAPLNIVPDGKTPRDPKQAGLYPALIKSRGEVNYAQEVALSPNGATLYVSRGYLGDIAAFSLRRRKLLWRLQMPSLRADHLAVSPDGRRIFVTSLPGTRVYAVDARRHRIVGSYQAGDFPHVLEFSPDGRYIYSGSLGNQLAPYGQDDGVHQITVADPRTLKVVRTYRFSAGVRPFAFTPNGKNLVLQLSFFNGFFEMNLRTGKTLRTVALPLRGPAVSLAPQNYPNNAAHHGIAIDRHNKVCDVGTISNYVALASLTATASTKIIPVPQGPGEALTSLDGRYCFVTSRGPTALTRRRVTIGAGDSLSIISYAKEKEIKRVRVGKHPQAETTGRITDATLKAGGFLTNQRDRHRSSR